ncbi:hypothetical protein Cgig2_010920 [Carnegiea gigantea]|uniref:Uncharacterized protein n=1 Tax=Carnegiea gigantea TaxID=171969 RepID=A0A9Q1K3U5_9CARY|nr:hypothetical protein Cgig2_010920 [Carnegiea gigantea]
MASIIANLPMPIFIHEAKPSLKPISKFPFCATPRRQSCVTVVSKATGDNSESSTSLSIVKSVQNVLDKPEDRIGVVGLGLAAIIALWALSSLISRGIVPNNQQVDFRHLGPVKDDAHIVVLEFMVQICHPKVTANQYKDLHCALMPLLSSI